MLQYYNSLFAQKATMDGFVPNFMYGIVSTTYGNYLCENLYRLVQGGLVL